MNNPNPDQICVKEDFYIYFLSYQQKLRGFYWSQ